MASHFRKLRVQDVRRETNDCVSVAFAVPKDLQEEFRFIQGQNITIRTRVGEEEIRRSYSICSSPFEEELRIAVKKVPGGLFSTYANDRLRIGDELEVLPPTGAFYTPLDPAKPKSYLAFAAGSGITPILSLIKTVLAAEPDSQFTLVYGNRHRPSIIFREELEALKNRYMHRLALHHILSREKTDISLHQGRIDALKCAELCDKLIDLAGTDEVFLCGPAQMIFTVKSWLEEKGVDHRKIHFELFHTQERLSSAGGVENAAVKTPLTGKISRVTVRLDGASVEFDLPFEGDSVLDAALLQGADLPFACKGGVCCTCRAKLVEGEVEMDVNYALEEDELSERFILTCQSHPRSEKVVIDFDTR
ncbi:1,2-phenylacetyl-CoA epoxidase subunit PaaE [Flavitalea sp. BT771]|uniref:1,2-phenylacetyl-CoA epoxidase subunit PaaE n=1 Tax=Flavitalea sp. BT771 TaxID=3063329 RepID=UPI0026E3C02A|nr:1,2-phenylacetyl-CoA epoxidase subunit PaaE [Flavitalea sp. BT771]MDO6433592.1 1,2-phenylacetyl-CoA epoxidase subunit PaaE [Flavitalea sp. BT771]MDV6222503.1 1,2-phenylacetyl-CoA epoxidase subunit PaaE [Flavitalea sp. BT771]